MVRKRMKILHCMSKEKILRTRHLYHQSSAGFMTQEWKKLEEVYSKKMKLGTLTFQQNWPHLNWSYKTPYTG